MNKYQSRTLLAAAVASAIAGTATAQDAPSGGLDEVTVTAQRREQSLQDVPISISAFGSDQLTSRNIVDTYDLVRNVPNLTGNANVGVGTSTSLYIRGIGNGESIATFDVPVGTYVDDVYISRQNQNNFGLFDVERIEVLRGPQGTLFGRNTTGGAINIVMRKPGTERRTLVEAGVGSFGLQQVRASIDVPVSDRFLTKFSAYRVQDDGFATQLSTGIDFNERDATAGRVDLRFLPSDTLTVDLVAEYIDDRNTNFLNVVSNDGRRVINNRLVQGALVGTFTGPKAGLAPGNEATTRAFTLNVKWDISDSLSLSSITGYRDTSHEFLVDSGGDLPRVTTTRGFTPLANIGSHEQTSQEFKLNGSAFNDTLTWVAGAFWMSEDNVTDFANANTNATTGVFSVAADRTMKNGLDTYAFYAQGDYKLTDRWTATLGIRYTDEKKDFAMERNPGAQGVNLNTAAIAAAGIPLELNEQVWTPRVALNFDATDTVSFFVSGTRGFKSGGWPARAVDNRAFVPFDPERVTAYEAGLRSTLFDNTLRMNVTAFYSMTDEIQIPARVDIDGFQISTTTNPADMRNVGVEIDAEWAPTDAFTLVAGVGIQNAEYTNIDANVLAQAAVCRANPAGFFQGAPACNANFVDQFGNIATPVRAPDLTVSLNATYDFDVGPVTVSPTLGWNYSDEYAIGTTGSPQSTNGTWSTSQAYVNAQLAFRFDNLPGLLLAIDCRNCADKAYPTTALGPFLFLDRPGTWGARVRYTF